MTHRKFNTQNIPLFALLIVVSFAATFVMVVKNVSEVFRWLPIMPAVFALCMFFGLGISDRLLNNLGILFVIAMLFVKMVLSPMLVVLSNYNVVLLPNYAENIDKAIILMCYECVALFVAMWIYVYKHPFRSGFEAKPLNLQSWKLSKIYLVVIILLIVIAIGCILLVPQITMAFRTILQINDPNFASLEYAYIVNTYGTTFIKKLACVIGNDVILILKLLVPGTLMVLTKQMKKKRVAHLISFCCIALPLLMVDGEIARSLYYCLVLFWFHAYLYWKFNYKRLILALVCAGLFVFAYWVIRFNVNNPGGDMYAYFSKTLSAYFSGVNVTAGVFNMDQSLLVRAKYFFYDYLKAVPFGNTLFGLDVTDTAIYFNQCNGSTGQIAPTIGLGYYYFGWILSPLYSVLFCVIGMYCSDKVRTEKNPITVLAILLTIVYMALGIGMYGVSIITISMVNVIIILIISKLTLNQGIKGEMQND